MWNAQLCSKFIQLDDLFAGGHGEKETARFFIAKKKIFRGDSFQRGSMRFRFGAGKNGGMSNPLIGESIHTQKGEKFLFGTDHSLEPVSLMPWMKVFCAKKNATMIGTVKTTEAAIN